MNDEEGRYKRAILGLFGAQEVEPGIVIHSGKDSPSFIASLVFKMREAFGSKAKIAKPGEETIETAKARRKNRERAVELTRARIEARHNRRKVRHPDKEISRFVSTDDLDINALLARPSTVGKRLKFAHTGQLGVDRKPLKKYIKKKIKEKKGQARKARREDAFLLIDKLERDIANLREQLSQN